MIQRRQFISLIGAATAAWPVVAGAQQSADRMRRVGILMPYAREDAEYESRVRALRSELGKLGWMEGVNIKFDERWTGDDMDVVRANAASLMSSDPDVVVAIGGRVVPVLMRLSSSIPIVVPGAGDPLGVGWVKSLARPGGNVTGFSFIELSVLGKMLEILKEAMPSISRVKFIYNPDNPSAVFYRRAVEEAAGPLAIESRAAPVHGLANIAEAIADLDRQNSGVLFPPDLTIQGLRHEVVDLIGRYGLPAIYSDPVFPKIGGLMYYGADRAELFRRGASYVDRILRGEKPGDLPFQQPTKYQLTINLSAAKRLGLNIPPTLLAVAEEVIE